MDQIAIEEYRSLRQEISNRVQILHTQLNIASAMLFVLLVVVSILNLWGSETYNWLLLTSFLGFMALGYNYQANQMTMEAVSRYISEKLEHKGTRFEWDEYWGNYKARVRLISFMKVFGLLFPTIFIFIWIFFTWSQFSDQQKILAAFDVLLFVIGAVNYRFKFGRI